MVKVLSVITKKVKKLSEKLRELIGGDEDWEVWQ